jgi:hypothetical protein
MAKTKEQFNIQRSQRSQSNKKGDNKWWIKL